MGERNNGMRSRRTCLLLDGAEEAVRELFRQGDRRSISDLERGQGRKVGVWIFFLQEMRMKYSFGLIRQERAEKRNITLAICHAGEMQKKEK